MTETDARRLRRYYRSEILHGERSRHLASEHARLLASTGGVLPPHPTVHSSLHEQKYMREQFIRYPPQLDSSAAPRKNRVLPVRGPNPPSYWVPPKQPADPALTTSNEVGAHTREWGGLYRTLTLDVDMRSERGRETIERLRRHNQSLPFVPSVHCAAAPVPGYSSPYNAEHKLRPQLESSVLGAFHHAEPPYGRPQTVGYRAH
jgi:hypothetical protein